VLPFGRNIAVPLKKLTQMPSVKSVMTPFPWSIDIGEGLREAKEMMATHGIRHLPVSQDGEIVGVLSERDLLNRDDESLTVDVACRRDAYIVDRATPLAHVAFEMARRGIGSALVTREGKLVGIFTSSDACRSLAELLQSLFPSGGNDAA
jgi:predicted transcriptional regulator